MSSVTQRVIGMEVLESNVPDVPRTLEEQYRALKQGGRVGSIDTSPPRDNWLRPFLEFHLHKVIPFLGRLIAGDAEAYTYLPDSTEKFLSAEDLASVVRTMKTLAAVSIRQYEEAVESLRDYRRLRRQILRLGRFDAA